MKNFASGNKDRALCLYYGVYKGSTNQKTGDSMVKPGKKLKKLLLIVGITGAVYGGFRYLLPLVIPFLLAYATALGLRPSVRFFGKKLRFWFRGKEKEIPAACIGGVELALLCAAAAGLFYFGGRLLLSQVHLFAARLPEWLDRADIWVTGLCRSFGHALGLKEDFFVELAHETVQGLREAARGATVPMLMNNSMAVVGKAVNVLVFLFIYFVAVILCLQEMEDIRERRSNSVFHREFTLLGRRLVSVGDAWLKTQLLIMALVSALCVLGLFLIGNPYCVLFGIGIGIMDALPVLGAGAALLPWSLLLFLKGQWGRGAVLLGLYGICYFLRQVMEAKIMGDKVGLSALETFASMYVGLKLFGFAGFLLGPIGLLMIEDLVELYGEEGSRKGH